MALDIVGYIPGYYEGDFTAICAPCADPYDTGGTHAVEAKEAKEFSDECTVCKKPLADLAAPAVSVTA